MDNIEEKNEEIQNRREFLKKTAKSALPILGISLFGPAILESCSKDSSGNNFGCNGCSGSCDSSCSGSCDDSCSGDCDGCTGTCWHTNCTYM